MAASLAMTVENLSVFLGERFILKNINTVIKKSKITAIAGESGCGKSTLLKVLLCLLKPVSGRVCVKGKNIFKMPSEKRQSLQRRWGVLFQQGALFSQLNVIENVIFPLKQFTSMTVADMMDLGLFKLALAGLSARYAYKSIAELSGGMQKRVALARALVLEPSMLFLDEPSSGLDPLSAKKQDDLLAHLQEALRLTIVMVTHDLHTLKNIADNILFLGDQTLLAEGSYAVLKKHAHPRVRDYFSQNL